MEIRRLALAALLLVGPAGHAEEPAGAERSVWRGLYCPPTGGRSSAGASLGTIAGFGAAVAGAAWAARRRPRRGPRRSRARRARA